MLPELAERNREMMEAISNYFKRKALLCVVDPLSTEDAYVIPPIRNRQLNQCCVEQNDQELVSFPCPAKDQEVAIRRC